MIEHLTETETMEAVKALLGRAAFDPDNERLYKQGEGEEYRVFLEDEEEYAMEITTEQDISQRIEELNVLYAAFGEAAGNAGHISSEADRMERYLLAHHAYQDAYDALLAEGVDLGFSDGQYHLGDERELEDEQED